MAGFDRQSYMRRYYLEKIRPHRKMRPPSYHYKCPMCGMRPPSVVWFERWHDVDLKLNLGSIWLGPADVMKSGDVDAASVMLAKINDFLTQMGVKSLSFCRALKKRGLLTHEQIVSLLGEVDVRYVGQRGVATRYQPPLSAPVRYSVEVRK